MNRPRKSTTAGRPVTAKPRPTSVVQADWFSKADELNASPKRPCPASHVVRIRMLRAAMEALRVPATATIEAWSLACMAGNVLESMLAHKLITDEQGLLQDAFDALKRSAAATYKPGDAIVLSVADWVLVNNMAEDFIGVLEQAPARDVIKAFRATDRRIREIEAGRVQAHDYTITNESAKHLGIQF